MDDNETRELDIEEVISTYKNYILKIIKEDSNGILSDADIEEVESEVYVRIWQNRKKLLLADSLKKYIVAIVKNATKDKKKSITKHADEVDITEEVIPGGYNAEKIYMDKEIKQEIAKEVSKLDEDEYDIFYRFYINDESSKVIAKEKNMTDANVRIKLFRIRNKIKREIEGKGLYTARKVISIIAWIIVAACGFTFAKEVIKHLFMNSSEGIKKAVDNGYVQEVKSNYDISNKIGLKVEDILMDDFNLNIIFNIKLDDKEDDILEVNIPNMLITDDNNNLIVAKFESKEDSKLYNNIQSKIDNNNYSGLNDGSERISIVDAYDNLLKISYVIHSDSFPRSKKLNIKMDKINLKYSNGKTRTINGNWNITINLSDEFYNREAIIYNMSDCNVEGLGFEYAKVTKSGCEIKFNIPWGDKIYNNNEEKEEKLKEYLLSKNKLDGNEAIKNICVENEHGNYFYLSNIMSGQVKEYISKKGKIYYVGIFDLTEYDLTDKLYLHFSKNNDIFQTENDEDVVVELTRK